MFSEIETCGVGGGHDLILGYPDVHVLQFGKVIVSGVCGVVGEEENLAASPPKER